MAFQDFSNFAHWVWGFHFCKAKTLFCMFILLAAGQCRGLSQMQLFGGFFNLRLSCTLQTVLEEGSRLCAVLGEVWLPSVVDMVHVKLMYQMIVCTVCAAASYLRPLCGLRWVADCFQYFSLNLLVVFICHLLFSEDLNVIFSLCRVSFIFPRNVAVLLSAARVEPCSTYNSRSLTSC